MNDDPQPPARARAELELALRELELRFDALLRASFEGLAISVDGVIVEANAALATILDRSREDLIGRHVLELCPPEAAKEVMARIGRGDERAYESQGLRADGTVFDGELQGKNATWRGRPARVTAFREIGWRKEVERRLEASAARFRDLADLLPAIILESDGAGTITFINRYGRDLLGYEATELIGTAVLRLVDPADHARARANFARRAQGEDLPPCQYTLVRRDGSRFVGELRASLVFEGGRPVGGRTVVTDLSERLAAEQARLELERRVQQAERLESLGLLAGGVAHDFNNLLAVMLGNTELALLELDATSAARRYVEAVGGAARRAADLVRQLLTYAGHAPFEPRAIDLNAVAAEMTSLLEVRASGRARLELALADGAALARGDAAQVNQVAMNLITNAIEAQAAGSRPDREHVVTIATSLVDLDPTAIRGLPLVSAAGAEGAPDLIAGRYAVLSVRDSAGGIPSGVRRRMFEPFFSTKANGRGLGLAAVLGVVRGHGGAIAVATEPGRGTRFDVFLPAAERPESASPQPEAKAAKSPQLVGAALVVDDQEAVAELIKLLLRRLGLEVVVCLDGAEAERVFAARSGGFDVVVLDAIMPDRSGLETLRALRAIAPEVPVVLCSGYAEDEARASFDDERIASFVQKPFDLETLRRAVTEALRGRRAP